MTHAKKHLNKGAIQAGANMNPLPVLKHPSAYLPLVMSVGALATALVFLTFKWLPQSPRQAVPILALQCAAALAAMAPVFLLHW